MHGVGFKTGDTMSDSSDTAPTVRKVGVRLGIGILLLPIVFAWFTLKKGYSTLARAVSFIWLVVWIGSASQTVGVTPSTTPTNAAGGEPTAAAAKALTRRDIAGNFTVIHIAPGVNSASLPDLARDICGSRPFCKVGAWTDETLLPRGFPMTDREVAGQVFSYTLNRDTGFEQSLWRCALFPQPSPDLCFS